MLRHIRTPTARAYALLHRPARSAILLALGTFIFALLSLTLATCPEVCDGTTLRWRARNGARITPIVHIGAMVARVADILVCLDLHADGGGRVIRAVATFLTTTVIEYW